MKTGLVFSGGGARGAYEIGVWKALEKLNIKCDIVTGVSIGSINALLYVQGSLKEAEKLWKQIDFSSVFSLDVIPKNKKKTFKTYAKSLRKGGLDPINLENKLKEIINIDKIYKSNIDYGLITVKYPKMKEVSLTKKEIKKSELIDYVIASSTVYPVFKLKKIEEEKYVDGGFKNSIPLDLAKKMGAEKLIVVNISGFEKRKKIDNEENIIFIKPNNKIGLPLVFDKTIASKSIKYGFNDTVKAFNKYQGKKYTFKDANKCYQKNEKINTFEKYINTLEYLGKYFNIDDTKVYTIKKFNSILIKKIKSEKVNVKKTPRKLLSSKERIIVFYNSLINGKRIRKPNNLFNKEYRSAYYLYTIMI